MFIRILLGLFVALNGAGYASGASDSSKDRTSFPLIEGLGSHRRPVTHCPPLAQQYFDQGMAFYYGFAHGSAIKSLTEAARLAPDCAMIHWAIALAHGPNINAPTVSEKAAAAAWAELQLARGLAANASPVEQALIGALAQRYADPQPKDRTGLNVAYAEAMRQVWQRFPHDADVGVFFAEAMMNLRPWNQFTRDGQAEPGTEEILATLEAALRLDLDHPYANHLTIHALEASPHPERALPAADRLLHLQPILAHNVHMPSHIYVRVGRWQDAIQSNLAAVAAQHRYEGIVGPPPKGSALPGYNAHNEHMLAYAAMMTGESALALDHVRAAIRCLTADYITESPDGADYFLAMPFEVLIRFGRWDEVLAEPATFPAEYPFTRAFAHAARAIAFAAKGNVPEARKEQTVFREAAKLVSPTYSLGLNPAARILALLEPMVEGEIDLQAGQAAEGIAALRQAAALQDALNYDEPPGWLIPVRHALGAALLQRGRLAEAEAVYRDDLQQYPNNGWALFGLARTLTLAGRSAEAKQVDGQFQAVWARADVTIDTSCLCQPGRQ
jgi:tetratricopeptide (TPR) repeat protein